MLKDGRGSDSEKTAQVLCHARNGEVQKVGSLKPDHKHSPILSGIDYFKLYIIRCTKHTPDNAMDILTILPLLLFSLMMNSVSTEFSADDCKSLGFNKANLLCSTCEEFNKHGLSEIWDKCKECCLKDDDYDASGSKRYPRAILEVCTCKFGAYPQIQAFIKSDRPTKYKNLQIKYIRGLDPIIKLLDADNKVEDILDIHKWDTDSVDEFLATHLSMD